MNKNPVEYIMSRIKVGDVVHPILKTPCWFFIPKDVPTTQININGKITKIPRYLKTTVEAKFDRIWNVCGDSLCVNPNHYGNKFHVIEIFGVEYKKCSRCKTFHVYNKDNFDLSGRPGTKYRSYCKSCRLKFFRNNRKTRWERHLINNAKNSAKLKQLEFNLTEEIILRLYNSQGGKCFWLGVNIYPSSNPKHPFQPSIDRIDRTKGYTEDNIVLTSFLANFGRNSSDADVWKESLKTLATEMDFSLWMWSI